MVDIKIDSRVEHVTMPDNLKVGLMVEEQRKNCESNGCNEEFYGLGFGQSPFHVPNVLQNALSENSDKGNYSASEGIKELREAVAEFNKKYFDLESESSRIVIGPGTKDIIHTIFGMLDCGVILPSPSWIGYRPQVYLLNKHFHTLHLRSENNYKITPDQLDSFVKDLPDKRHILVLNNPHNPTGMLYSKKELEAITEICRKHNILVLADEIYALTTYDFSKFTSMGKIYPEGTFVTNGLSKDRSAGGYRLGSCVLPTTLSKKLESDYKKVAATIYTNVSTPTQYAAIQAYKDNKSIDEYIATTRKIHEIMGRYLSQQWDSIPEINTTKPEGTFYFFVDFNQLGKNLQERGMSTSNKLSESLLSCPFHIAVVTGDACMLEPNDYGARVAFVDYDGEKTFENYRNVKPKNNSEEMEFVKQNAPRMVNSVKSLRRWVEHIKGY